MLRVCLCERLEEEQKQHPWLEAATFVLNSCFPRWATSAITVFSPRPHVFLKKKKNQMERLNRYTGSGQRAYHEKLPHKMMFTV